MQNIADNYYIYEPYLISSRLLQLFLIKRYFYRTETPKFSKFSKFI